MNTLSDEQIASYRDHGYMHLRGVLQVELIDGGRAKCRSTMRTRSLTGARKEADE